MSNKRNFSKQPSAINLLSFFIIAVMIVGLAQVFSYWQKTTDPRSDASLGSQAGLHMTGSTVAASDNSRFVFKGVNVEYYRDAGCSYVTENTKIQKEAIVNKMKVVGINTVRLNYKASWLDDEGNITHFLDLMQLYAQNGIYVMPSDHSFTGKVLSNYDQVSYPMFEAIIKGARARGFEEYVILNPYNEPYGVDQTASRWPSWVSNNNATLDYLRNNLNFKGIVVLDTKDWAANYDAASLQEVQRHDAELLAGTANVIFSHHWYPNIPQSKIDVTNNAANQLPLLIGEIGQYNATPDSPEYVKNALASVINTGIPKGHNGVFPWMWAWCDSNNMTKSWDNLVDLSSYGQLFVDNYYTKVPASMVPGTGVPITVSPTPTAPPSPIGDPPRTSPSPKASPIPSPVGDPQQSGLTGQYFDGTNWDTKQLKLTRVDDLIAFKWGSSHPVSSVGDDDYSVRWTGSLTAPMTGWFGIFTTHDDGVAVSINNKLLIWDLTKSGLRQGKAAVYLEKGTSYPVKVEYVEKSGNAEVGLYWKYGTMRSRQLIPSAYFSPI